MLSQLGLVDAVWCKAGSPPKICFHNQWKALTPLSWDPQVTRERLASVWGILELVCTDLTSAKAQTEDSESGFPFSLLPAHSLFPGVDKGSREKSESGLGKLGAEEGSRD